MCVCVYVCVCARLGLLQACIRHQKLLPVCTGGGQAAAGDWHWKVGGAQGWEAAFQREEKPGPYQVWGLALTSAALGRHISASICPPFPSPCVYL